MIVRDKPGITTLFFVYRGSVAPRVLPQILIVLALALGMDQLVNRWPAFFPQITTAPFIFLGVALSLYLGFRNNACYERWWEARKMWGQLVIDCRSLTRLGSSYFDPADEQADAVRRRLLRLQTAFVLALKDHLRTEVSYTTLAPWLTVPQQQVLKSALNVPDRLLKLLGQELGVARRNGLLSDIAAQNFEKHLDSLAVVLASCERIKATPLPLAYTLLVHRICYLYCFLLPIGLVSSVGWLTPFIAATIAYAFFGLDELSQELEQPFGTSDNHLPLDAMARQLEREALQALGVEQLPPPIAAQDHRLS